MEEVVAQRDDREGTRQIEANTQRLAAGGFEEFQIHADLRPVRRQVLE